MNIASQRKGLSLLLLSGLIVTVTMSSCQAVKPYQRVYLNDYEMRPGKNAVGQFEENVHTYREGATGGGGGKTSGGCGCN